MPGLQYVYIPLESASLIQRQHDRDVLPPGLVTIENFISSRSDNVPTLRPDVKDDSSIRVKAFRTLLGDESSLVATDEYLNSAFGLYGGENLIFLTTRFPIDNSDDVSLASYSGVEYSTVISKVIDAGTATAAVNDGISTVIISDPTQINMNQKAWYGACLLFDGDDTYWPIRLVNSKTNVVLECRADFTDATADFSVVQSHCPANTGYKFHTELFLSNSIYNTPIFDAPFSTQRISGPFIGNISEKFDYNDYFGNLIEFSGSITDYFQDPTQTSEYGQEIISRKTSATGTALFMTTKPFYNKKEGDPLVLAHAGPYYTITPEIPSSYLPPVDGGAGDIFSALPLGETHEAFWNRSFSRAKIIFDGTNKFYMPVVAYTDDLGGEGPDYSIAIMEFADDSAPTVTGHLTDYSLGATEPDFYFTNICYNATDSTIWITHSNSQTEVGGNTFVDNVIIVDVSDWSTTTTTMPTAIQCFGLEFSATGNCILATGVDSSDDGFAMKYNLTSHAWTTLTNPGPNVRYYGCGIYDDGTNWVFTISGFTALYYWGKLSGSTIVDTGSEFSSDLGQGAFRTVSNGFVYDPTGTPTYSTAVVLSGHNKVGIAAIDPTTSSVSFIKLIDETFDTSTGTYIGKFQRQILYVAGAEQFVVSHPVGGTTLRNAVSILDISPGTYVSYYVDEFTPISDLYRSKCYGIVNGYVVLFGLLEYDAVDDEWDYTPRRIRWTAPATVNNFTLDGSGTADVLGNGEFIDARTVNERIVMFESNAISTLVPRGIVDDPFDYEVIHRGIRIASNPCVVNDIIYFIADDGLLYSTNGVTVEELGASFDLTKFDDFDDKRPAWLVYSVELNSLLVFYPDDTIQTVYCICLANGLVTSWDLLDASDVYPVKSIVAVESSSDISTFVGYNPQASGQTYDEVCTISVLETGEGIDGVDTIGRFASSGNWYGEIETGNLFNEKFPEGIKIALKHIIVHTYTDSSTVTYNPDIVIEVKSVEDTAWSGADDILADSAITISSTTASLSDSTPPTAFSNVLGTADETAQTYNLPWIAANCRIYTKTGSTYTACTLVTSAPDAVNEYQITGTKQIKVYGTTGHTIYCFCENEPVVKAKVGDYVETTNGLLRITAITDYNTATLYSNRDNGLTGSHIYSEQIPVGSGKVKVAINKLVEGCKLRIRVVPRVGGEATIVKITGISLGYVPLGEKILEATGG